VGALQIGTDLTGESEKMSLIKGNGTKRSFCHQCGGLICGNDRKHNDNGKPQCGNCRIRFLIHHKYFKHIEDFAWQIARENARIVKSV